MCIFGLFLFTYGVFGDFENEKWKEFVSGLGKTFLAGAIFSMLLKTAQFLGVFKEEIEKVIYDTKFISNRVDLPEYWEKVTKELFKNRFPRINKAITKDVKEIYLQAGYQFITKQWRVPANSDFAAPPAEYGLLSAELGSSFKFGKQQLNISIAATNLLNEIYRDYLDRFRYFADSQGQNFTLRIKVPLTIYDKK